MSEWRRAFFVFAALGTLVFAGCAGQFSNYGDFDRSREVSGYFESGSVLPQYSYYYSGSEGIPNAIIGIGKKYELATGLWKPVNLTQEKLNTWVDLMNGQGPPIFIEGSFIRDNSGKAVGIWYSRYDTSTVKVDGNKVTVWPPDTERRQMQLNPFNLSDW